MKKYLITDPQYYSNDIEIFRETLIKTLTKHEIDIACFRDKESKNFEELAKIFIEICKKFNVKEILLNSNYLLAKKLGASGVHLNSKQFDKIKEAKEKNLFTIISCHTFLEIEKAMKLKADAITFSPIFNTPNKGEPKGIEKLEEATNLYKDIKIIALGGIVSEEQISKIENTKAYGFASIRYFI
ncbi:MAG: thiamine phosphate synthase [Arcobacter sp.]|uniref:thiamine phosphate synthase n=1 Tax=Arcobacter sp. TaxID=1872629 RepID=UPI003D0CCC82